MRPDRMTLDPRAFGLAAGTVTAVLFALCALAVALAPGATAAAFGYMLHLDLAGIARPLTWSGFVSGLLCMSIGVGLVFAAAAALYNRFLRGLPAVAPADLAAPRGA